MAKLLSHLPGDCSFRDTRRGSADFCGAFLTDMSGARPPDRPQPPAQRKNRGRASGLEWRSARTLVHAGTLLPKLKILSIHSKFLKFLLISKTFPSWVS